MEKTTDIDILKRLLQAANVTKDSELSNILGLTSQAVSKVRNGKKIPAAWIPKIAEMYNVSSDWLFFGIGEMNRNDNVKNVISENENSNNFNNYNILQNKKLEEKLEKVESQRDELVAENRQLLKENGDLRVRIAKLEAIQTQSDTSTQKEDVRFTA